MQLPDLNFLTSPRGESLLAELATADLRESQTLSLVTRLRKDYSTEETRAALGLARLRVKARDKFGPDAARMFFTANALQQASDPLVRDYRARIVRDGALLDAGCGVGADSLAFASHGATVLGVDLDPLRVAMARLNAAALSLPDARFDVADLRDGIPGGYDTVFFDPARRDEHGRRIHDVKRYIPPLSIIEAWDVPRIAVKLSPGVDLSQIAPYAPDGGIEFVSVRGDLKEALLWRGFAHDAMRATLLDGDHAYHYTRAGDEPEIAVTPPRAFLLEPNAAIIRAGLVRDLAADLDATMLDPTIAYITADTAPDSAWVRSWRVLDWMPFHLKKLRAYLRERNVGHLTVKKRGSPLTPEALIARLKPKGDESRTLVLTRYEGAPVVLICA